MGKIEKQLQKLLIVGDVGLYTTEDGGWGVSLDFYDGSYYLAHPADSIKKAVNEMLNEEWRVAAALAKPAAYHQLARKKKLNKEADEFYETVAPKKAK